MNNSNNKVVLKILVNCRSDNSCQLLRYVRKNIKLLCNLGVKIVVARINPDEMEPDIARILHHRGITRLPALVMPDASIKIGVQQIVMLLEQNIARIRGRTGCGVPDSALCNYYGQPYDDAGAGGSTDDLTEYYARQIYTTDDRGRTVWKRDDDEEETDKNDIESKLAQYQRRVPNHRRDVAPPDFDRAQARMQRKRAAAGLPGGMGADPDDNSEEEYGGYDMPAAAPTARNAPAVPPDNAPTRGATTHGVTMRAPKLSNQMDDIMLRAWMENNPF